MSFTIQYPGEEFTPGPCFIKIAVNDRCHTTMTKSSIRPKKKKRLACIALCDRPNILKSTDLKKKKNKFLLEKNVLKHSKLRNISPKRV